MFFWCNRPSRLLSLYQTEGWRNPLLNPLFNIILPVAVCTDVATQGFAQSMQMLTWSQAEPTEAYCLRRKCCSVLSIAAHVLPEMNKVWSLYRNAVSCRSAKWTRQKHFPKFPVRMNPCLVQEHLARSQSSSKSIYRVTPESEQPANACGFDRTFVGRTQSR